MNRSRPSIPPRRLTPTPASFFALLFLSCIIAIESRLGAQSASDARITEMQFFNLYERGGEHAHAGDSERALADWLMAFDRSRGVPGLEEARLSLPLDAILALAEGYEPAHAALVERRNAAERALVERQAVIEDAEEVVALNALLAGPARSIAAFDRYKTRRGADPEIVAVLRDLLWSDLIAAGRYDELADEAELRAKELIPLIQQAREAMERYDEEAAAADDEFGDAAAFSEPDIPEASAEAEPAADSHHDAGEIWHESGDEMDLVSEAIGLFEVLLGSGREEDAVAIRDAILRLEPESHEIIAEIQAEFE